jgi:hypothetical protein
MNQIKIAILLLLPALSLAQVPVDDNGNVIGKVESQADIMPLGDDGIPRLSQAQLQELVGPIALYPDDLLAIVLPASAYPLQVVEAARFLEALKSDPTLKPDADWDDSIVALINYPEVVELLNKDLDWTWRLGEAVVAQQADVVAAVESFRDRAYAAGNLKSDSYQTVANDDGVISISPAAEDVIYVPYYEPARVVYYQPRPAYYYYPQPRPVYYYPYAANHYFDNGYFWGVTTAFSIGWRSDSLHVYHHSYRGHPYYGRTYWNDGWYRRPSINVYNTTYVTNTNVVVNRDRSGDRWRANNNRREYVRREGYTRAANRTSKLPGSNVRQYEPVSFREREARSIPREARRQDIVDQSRNTHRAVNANTSTNARSANARSENARSDIARSTSTRRQDATQQIRATYRQESAQEGSRQAARRQVTSDRARNTATQSNSNRSRAAQHREPVRQVERPTTTRTDRAPQPTQRRQSPPAERQQPSRSSESRSNESRSERPERSSSETRGKSRSKSRDRRN